MSHIKVLISHSHDEKALAEAWKNLLDTISLGGVEVWFSSDVTPSGGMEIGKEWREQLYERLNESDFIIAIQTPSSSGRPWIMWECGVASGIAKERGLIPVVFAMGRGDLANPLTTYQVYQGEDKGQVLEVCQHLLAKANLKLQEPFFDITFEKYQEYIRLHRPRKPVRVEQVTLWRTRFEELIRSGCYEELIPKRQAMYAALGTPFNPVEPTVHELLSKSLLDLRHYKEAIEEADFALSLVGDDIDLLHRKALALTELQDLPEAEAIIGKILAEHVDLRQNPELASLEGRIHKERWLITNEDSHLNLAFDAYLRAYLADQTQYYPGINAGSLALAKGDIEGANKIFSDVIKTCQELQKRTDVSFWVDFSAGEALLGMGNVEEARGNYQKALSRSPAPPPRARLSALNGARRMVKAKGLQSDSIESIESILKPLVIICIVLWFLASPLV